MYTSHHSLQNSYKKYPIGYSIMSDKYNLKDKDTKKHYPVPKKSAHLKKQHTSSESLLPVSVPSTDPLSDEESESDSDSDYETVSDDEDDDTEESSIRNTVIKKSKKTDKNDIHDIISKLMPTKYSKKSEQLKERIQKDFKSYLNQKKYEEDEENAAEEVSHPSKSRQRSVPTIYIMPTINQDEEYTENGEYISEYEEDSEEERVVDDKTEEKNFMKESYKDLEPVDELSTPKLEEESIDLVNEYKDLIELKEDTIRKIKKHPRQKVLQRTLDDINDSIKKLIKKGKKTNAKEFYRLIHADKKQKSEIDYFENQLSHTEQQRVITKFKQINAMSGNTKYSRLAIIQSDLPDNIKYSIMQRIQNLADMRPEDSEYFKLKKWVDGFLRIPFGKKKTLPVTINDGIDKCDEFIKNAVQTLDNCAYGMDEAKMQIIQLIGQWITNPNSKGNVIALHGAMGTGKTSLIRDGISKILGRDFVFIPLGGCIDGGYLNGYSYTWEGSMYGKIVQSLIECQNMTPIFCFDEVDKLSTSPQGQEITGILTHITDPTQNSEFYDKYYPEVPIDLSSALYFFTYNDESAVNAILRDRMFKIHTKGYQTKDKLVIGPRYMLPKILADIQFDPTLVSIPDSVMSYIIEYFTGKEEGVRNLKRCLEIIFTKLNLYRITKSGTSFIKNVKMPATIVFPHVLTNSDVDVFLRAEQNTFSARDMMYN
jgi:ATP-dependent Lon protease